MGKPDTHDTCETTQGITLLACTNRSHCYPDFRCKPPPASTESHQPRSQTVLCRPSLYSTLPFAELAGSQGLHSGPAGTRLTASHYLTACAQYIQKLATNYHTTRPRSEEHTSE